MGLQADKTHTFTGLTIILMHCFVDYCFMSDRILIAYASKTNAAALHAGAIAGVLKGAGREVDLVNLRETRKPELDRYDGVVIGSGVRIGRWYGPARRLLKRKELDTMKIALFVACGMACDEDKVNEAVEKLIVPMASKYGLKVLSSQAFAGLMPGDKNVAPLNTEASMKWGSELASLL